MTGRRFIHGLEHWRCPRCKRWHPRDQYTTRHAMCNRCKHKRDSHEEYERAHAREVTWNWIGRERN